MYLRAVAADHRRFSVAHNSLISCFSTETFNELLAVEATRLSRILIESDGSSELGNTQAASVGIDKDSTCYEHTVSQTPISDVSPAHRLYFARGQVRIFNKQMN